MLYRVVVAAVVLGVGSSEPLLSHIANRSIRSIPSPSARQRYILQCAAIDGGQTGRRGRLRRCLADSKGLVCCAGIVACAGDSHRRCTHIGVILIGKRIIGVLNKLCAVPCYGYIRGDGRADIDKLSTIYSDICSRDGSRIDCHIHRSGLGCHIVRSYKFCGEGVSSFAKTRFGCLDGKGQLAAGGHILRLGKLSIPFVNCHLTCRRCGQCQRIAGRSCTGGCRCHSDGNRIAVGIGFICLIHCHSVSKLSPGLCDGKVLRFCTGIVAVAGDSNRNCTRVGEIILAAVGICIADGIIGVLRKLCTVPCYGYLRGDRRTGIKILAVHRHSGILQIPLHHKLGAAGLRFQSHAAAIFCGDGIFANGKALFF